MASSKTITSAMGRRYGTNISSGRTTKGKSTLVRTHGTEAHKRRQRGQVAGTAKTQRRHNVKKTVFGRG